MPMERVAHCPICQNEDLRAVVHMDAYKLSRFQTFDERKYDGLMTPWIGNLDLSVLHCGRCNHYSHSHMPDESALSEMYAACHPMYGEPSPVREASRHMITEMGRLRRLVAHQDEPTLLDFGSGFGRWARAAVQAGFTVTAFEPSAERGQEKGAVPFELVHDLQTLKGRRFDVINIEQVLEHVRDPVALLRLIRGFCHGQTVLRITVPNVLRSYEGDKIWQDWPFDGQRVHTMAPFEHLHGFTPASLAATVQAAGLAGLPSAALWRHYPFNKIRQLASFFMPRLGQTLILARLP